MNDASPARDQESSPALVPPVLVLVGDFFFRAKIEATARAAGIAVRCCDDVAKLGAEETFSGCLVDLESAGARALARLPGPPAAPPPIGVPSPPPGGPPPPPPAARRRGS